MDLNQHIWSQFETIPAKDRVIFLGASNLSRSFSTAVSIARATLRAPLTIHAAMGHGRAYGIDSGFFRKKFPKIFSCGIWQSLSCENADRTLAFVTDVGNDLAYEAPVDVVLKRVTMCVERLHTHRAEVVITALPIASLERLSWVRFRLLRGLFFPKCRLELADFIDRVQELNAGLEELGINQKTSVFTVPSAWYGLDPIHPRRRKMTEYWRELFALSGCSDAPAIGMRNSVGLNCYLQCLTAPSKRLGELPEGESIKRIQLFDGTRISLY